MWHITLSFVNIEAPLHPRNKTHLIVVYDILNVLLDSVLMFVEDFCNYIHDIKNLGGGYKISFPRAL